MVDLGRVDGRAEKGVVEHVAYVERVIRASLCRIENRVLRDSLAGMGLASISVMKAAKRPIL